VLDKADVSVAARPEHSDLIELVERDQRFVALSLLRLGRDPLDFGAQAHK
jgi:hypothetical protein